MKPPAPSFLARLQSPKVLAVIVTLAILAAVRLVFFSTDATIWPLPPAPLTRAAAEAANDGDLASLIGQQMDGRARALTAGGWRDLRDIPRTAWLVTCAQDLLVTCGSITFTGRPGARGEASVSEPQPQSSSLPSFEDLATANEEFGATAVAQLLRNADLAVKLAAAQAFVHSEDKLGSNKSVPNALAQKDTEIRTALASPEYQQLRVAWMRKHLDQLTVH